jgi:hypothetical protein
MKTTRLFCGILAITAAFSISIQAQSFLTNGLVVYYPFNGNANDASGNGNNGIIYGGVTLAPDRFGNPNSAYTFDGVDGYIDVGNPLGDNPAYLTESAWVKIISRTTNWDFNNPAVSPPIDVIMTKRQNGADGSGSATLGVVCAGTNAGAGLIASDAGYHWTPCTGTTLTSTNDWFFICGVVSNGTFQIYVNGVLENSITDLFPLSSTDDIYLMHEGAWVAGTFFCNGTLDDVRIYNRALSSNEIAQLYAYESQATNPPSITGQPQPVIANVGDNVSFNVTASGTVPLSYKWSLNGTNIPSATASSLTISNVAQTDLGEYAVVVSNAFGSVASSNALLSMYPFLVTPFGGSVAYWGQNATLSVAGWGTGPLSYQWFDDGVAILNATNQTLTFSSVQFTNAGLYSVVVSNPLGSVTNIPEQVVVNVAGVSLGFSPTLTIVGVPGFTYVIQSSTNLANTNSWVTLTNLTLTQPVELFIDTTVDASSPFNPKTFYKILPGQ